MALRVSAILFTLLQLLSACGKQQPEIGFYRWKEEFRLSEAERALWRDTHAQRLYLHVADIIPSGGEGMPIPTYRMRKLDSLPAGAELVPCLYIDYRIFLGASPPDGGALADRMLKLTDKLLSGFGEAANYRELQLDCDWTPQCRAAYFALCDSMRTRLQRRDAELSCTIRLHQARDHGRTGVPPADRGVLMFYNMGIGNPNSENNILDLEIGRNYVKDLSDYPLLLDLALPLFSWGRVERLGKPVFTLPGLAESQIPTDSSMERSGPHTFKVLENRYFQGRYLYRDDLIHLDAVEPDSLLSAARYLTGRLGSGPERLLFFQLDSLTTTRYEANFLLDVAAELP